MKHKNKKQILKKIANKNFRRKLRSKQKKQTKRRLNIGISKEQKKQSNRFKGHKHIVAPTIFSLIDNTDNSLYFIEKIEDCFKKRQKVWIDLKKVEIIAHGAIIVLLSILVKFKANKIGFIGQSPENSKANNALEKSGFLEYLFDKKKIKEKDDYTFGNEIYTHANKTVTSKLITQLINKISNYIWGEERQCSGLKRVLVELMQNTNNHASIEKEGEYHWWINIDTIAKDKVCFTFIDYGVGIIESLKSKKPDQTFHGVWSKINDSLGLTKNEDIIKKLLKGEIHNIMKYNRGKGLPSVFKECQKNSISNLKIITNDVMADCSNNKYTKLKNKLSGTFLY